MPNHHSALRTLREAGHKDTVEYIQTLEAHNQLLQDELERVLTLLAEQAALNQQSNVAERADAVLKYTREYLSRQH
ncbi:hypothetical protein EMM73_01300 [Rheinheimera sediminis]|uniref:hypothetical protein n=1 Tax=Rheinheimera sp. YQF-1 TaxID=2499626 RepID=UPI000FD872F7|nr:hypothetical protein [Rheinheimera sp. YQF-1]RVT48608.1 hypothetical protein EMM73_01300 [Rheinheimera sp. YQF-1]